MPAQVVFVIWELGDRPPMLDLATYQDRNFFIGAGAASLLWVILVAGLVVFPLWQQDNVGYTPTWAGWRRRRLASSFHRLRWSLARR